MPDSEQKGTEQIAGPRPTTTPSEAHTKEPGTEVENKHPALDNKWMLRECDRYKEEYRDCKSWSDRFHQYYVEGKTRDCEQWHKDYLNCLAWENKGQTEALAEVVESEKERMRTRLKAHYANDVWKNRDGPPSDWDKELPDHITKGYKGSFLQFKANEIKEGVLNEDGEYIYSGSKCTIL